VTSSLMARVASGSSKRREMTFSVGSTIDPFSVGTAGDWKVDAPGVRPVHVFLYFDGANLSVMSTHDDAPALVHGAPVPGSWTSLPVPAVVSFGEGRLTFSAIADEQATTLISPANLPPHRSLRPPPRPLPPPPFPPRATGPRSFPPALAHPSAVRLPARDRFELEPTVILEGGALEVRSIGAKGTPPVVGRAEAQLGSATTRSSPIRNAPRASRIRRIALGVVGIAVVALGANALVLSNRAPPTALTRAVAFTGDARRGNGANMAETRAPVVLESAALTHVATATARLAAHEEPAQAPTKRAEVTPPPRPQALVGTAAGAPGDADASHTADADARSAADAIVRGDADVALILYTKLAAEHPRDRTFQVAREVLTARSAEAVR
jgi:hypothetical protein